MVLVVKVRNTREGSLNLFEDGDIISMANVIFYVVLKSLDTMSEISALDYRDSPVVSIELVKFLFLNTSVETVDKLETQSIQLTYTVKQMNRGHSYKQGSPDCGK